jgi:cytosine/adenosine deaminase-related metal-dependent hydrolase
MSQSPILMKNGTIITFTSASPTIKVFKSSILIRDGKIVKIGDNLPDEEGVRVIDCQRCFISAGFVDAHRHLWQTQARGQLGDYSLMEYVSVAHVAEKSSNKNKLFRMSSR